MAEVHRYKVLKMKSEDGGVLTYTPVGPEIVMAAAYDALLAENAALRAKLPSQGGEAVEVVATVRAKGFGRVFEAASADAAYLHCSDGDQLMTVSQHQRILAASVGSAEPVAWREHSVNYAKGEKCPETIETLQAAWDRDQELINDMRHEIARHKTRINRLEQRRPADQVADDLTMVKVPRELLEQIVVELEHDNDRYLLGRELRALLANSEGAKG